MADDPLDSVYSFVERAYIRLQAGDVLIRCLEEGHAQPIQEMVDSLVLAGPKSLNALREILAEAEQRKDQVQDDVHQVLSDLESSLKSYGVRISGTKSTLTVSRLSQAGLVSLLDEQGIKEVGVQENCLRVLRNAREVMVTLVTQLHLLNEVENYIRDWMWGLAYQTCHTEVREKAGSSQGCKL